MVVTQSTKGTSATRARNRSGARLATAPMSRPPAEPPRPASAPSRAMPPRPGGADSDEVAERVGLVLHAPALVPGPPHLPRRHGRARWRDHPAVEERETVVGERRVDRHLVGAVAVEHARRGRLQAVGGARRRPGRGPVIGGGPFAVCGVAGGVEVAQDGLLLQQRLHPVCQADLQDARGRHHGGTPDAQRGRVRLGVGTEPGRRRAVDGGGRSRRRPAGRRAKGSGPASARGRTWTCVCVSARSASTRARAKASTSSTRTPGRWGTTSRQASAPEAEPGAVSGAARTRKSWASSLVSATNQPGPPRAGVRWSRAYSTPSCRGT